MQIIIVAHYARSEWLERLQRALPGAAAILDCTGEGAFEGHRKALKIAEQVGGRCVIMEDDAIPVEGFRDKVEDWFARFPKDLISFYLGTGRPVAWQTRVDEALAATNSGHIALSRLIHGVCYSVPAGEVSRVLGRLHQTDDGADFAIGRAWGRQVLYPVESLVEHRDSDSVEKHPDGEPRTERRVARCLAGPLMYER